MCMVYTFFSFFTFEFSLSLYFRCGSSHRKCRINVWFFPFKSQFSRHWINSILASKYDSWPSWPSPVLSRADLSNHQNTVKVTVCVLSEASKVLKHTVAFSLHSLCSPPLQGGRHHVRRTLKQSCGEIHV